ncbi:hypothetical protein ACLBKU_01780 [Erythrobacter sp. NE805]|uniref:hypothetical protein n=1 Tax=Erythrobacter sp. NE805 TaxID=3389875 RepID=UPI00396B04D5
MMRSAFLRGLLAAALLATAGCGGGGSSGGGTTPPPSGGGGGGGSSPVYTQPAVIGLSSADVGRIVAQAATQAEADRTPAVITVIDRVGNVLAIFRMTGAPVTQKIPNAPNGNNLDLQGASVPAETAAIAKALTAAYFSSQGNAFSSRTAGGIIQETFPKAPSTGGLESGALFSVQFSQLPCSDISARFVAGQGATPGPKRSAIGFAADAGGFPLYRDGVLIGAVGVAADPDYGFDTNVLDFDNLPDERIALAATVGFEAAEDIRADKIALDGTLLRYSDIAYNQLSASVLTATYANVAPRLGNLAPLRGYYDGTALLAGTAYGSEASGVRPARSTEFANPDAYVVSDGAGNNRFPIRAGTDAAEVGQPLTEAEVRTIFEESFAVLSRTRSQVRKPVGSRAEMTLVMVDTRGEVLGIIRSPDALVDAIDATTQKARSVTFFSNARADDDLLAAGDPRISAFVTATRTFASDPAVLDGKYAFSNRSLGNIARPYFPDGQFGTAPGPLSRPIDQWSIFSTGLQSTLVVPSIVEHLQFIAGARPSDVPRGRCTSLPDASPNGSRIRNGITLFPGAVPIYRGNVLVGGIGASGDGIDQNDLVPFLGLYNAGVKLGTGIGNAPASIRADRIAVPVNGTPVRLRYVNCPFAPFLDTTQQNVCQGL